MHTTPPRYQFLLLITFLALLPACTVNIETVATVDGLAGTETANAPATAKPISVLVVKNQPIETNQTLESSYTCNAHHDYNDAFVPAILRTLSRDFKIVQRNETDPHVRLTLSPMKAFGSCTGKHGGFWRCTSTVKFAGKLHIAQKDKTSQTFELASTGNETTDYGLNACASMDTIHTEAAKKSFQRLMKGTSKHITDFLKS